MNDTRHLIVRVTVMLAAGTLVIALAAGLFYRLAVERQRNRLTHFVETEVQLVERMVDACRTLPVIDSTRHDPLDFALAIHEVLGRHATEPSEELLLGRRQADVTLVRKANSPPDEWVALGTDATRAEPMRAALSGQEGTMIGTDNTGRRVLAVFRAIGEGEIGVVAQKDMAIINTSYQYGMIASGLIAFVVVCAGVILTVAVNRPVLARLRESEGRYRLLFNHLGAGAAVYQVIDDGVDFRISDLNSSAETSDRLSRLDAIGRSLFEIYPNLASTPLLGALIEAWRTGQAQSVPTYRYQDDRIDVWREAFIYRLPTKELIVVFFDVGERVRTEARLSESEQRYRALVERQPDLICQFLADTTLTFVNDAYTHYFGRDRNELIGTRWINLMPANERAQCLADVAAITPETPNLTREQWVDAPDGTRRWYLWHFQGYFDDSGKALGYQAFGTDLTARRRAEEALRESESLLTAVLDHAPALISIKDVEGRVILANRHFAVLEGPSLQDTGMTSLFDLYPAGRTEEMTRSDHEVLASGEPCEIEEALYHYDGTLHTYLTIKFALRRDETSFGVCAIRTDITRRKEAEGALMRSEERLSLALEIGEIATWDWDLRTDRVVWTEQYRAIFGLADNSRESVPMGWWRDSIHPEDLPRIVSLLADTRNSGTPYAASYRIIRADDSRTVWIEEIGRYLYNEEGEAVRMLGVLRDITERKEAELVLRQSEARFRGTFENAAVGIAHVHPDGRWLRVNDRLCQIVGYSREELLTRTFQDITHPNDRSADRACRRLLKGGEMASTRMERRYIHKQGHVIWVNLTLATQHDDDGAPLYFITVIEDISARKQAEEELNESRVRTRALIDASEDEIMLIEADGTVLAVNDAAEARLASRANGSPCVGQNIRSLMPADLAEERMRSVAEAVRRRTVVHQEKTYGARWVDVWIYPVVRPGTPVVEVASYVRDVTERRRIEGEIRKLHQAIHQSPISVLITDKDGIIEYANPKCCEITGYTIDELIGKSPRILKSGHTDVKEYKVLWKTIVGGQVWRGEFLNRRKDGELVWELASIAPVKNDIGQVTNFVALKEDITKQKTIEQQLHQTQQLQALGQLTGGIAHDFNNLLAIIVGNLELLAELTRGNVQAESLLNDALWSAERGAELTHRLLAFARRQPLKPAVTDVNHVVHSMLDLLRRTLGSGIGIRASFADGLWPSNIDAGELERALVNLAVNARDAMNGSGTLTIETRNVEFSEEYTAEYTEVIPGHYALISIIDTGSGMPPDVLKRVFEPFFTTKDFGKGSGLGLSMVYGFAKQSGGHASIYSEVGKGTTVHLYLPSAGVTPKTETSAAIQVRPLQGVVLVVEEDDRLRHVAGSMLHKLGLQVIEAATGREALACLDQGQIDLLFVGAELGGDISGVEIADKTVARYSRACILFTTCYTRKATPALARFGRRAAWITKPYSRTELGMAIAGLLAQA
ncbi:MAG: PAS domain S-box protein [Rhodospirillales bacterium]